ncbi:MAG TPA: DUF1861 family protein [Clostridia bacterium]|nr:DUF1861 family protein [Clostridia bacterium]
MTFKERKERFDRERPVGQSALLTFTGVDGFDVYNCSIPFCWEGKQYIYGRVERRAEWARSWVRLFERVAPDSYALVPGSMIYQLEDPYAACIGGEMVLGGTHVRMRSGNIDTVYGYFYKGRDLEDLVYFTTGPEGMKDIRLVELEDGIGVFSRPRNAKVRAEYGSESVVGFAKIPDLAALTAEVIDNAPVVTNMFAHGEWGGCNQCYRLDSGYIGIIGHKSYPDKDADGNELAVYTNVAFVMDPKTNGIVHEAIIATRGSYPPAPAKRPKLLDCAFTSGIVMRPDGKADLYSGVGDTMEGRAVIEDPFKGFGRIVGTTLNGIEA